MKRNITYTFICLLAALFAAGCARTGADDPVPGIGEGRMRHRRRGGVQPAGPGAGGPPPPREGTPIINTPTSACFSTTRTGSWRAGIPSEVRRKTGRSRGYGDRKQTPRAEFKLTVPYGRYRIYAVASMGT